MTSYSAHNPFLLAEHLTAINNSFTNFSRYENFFLNLKFLNHFCLYFINDLYVVNIH